MTEKDYHIKLGYLRERNSKHSLLPLIEREYSVMNCAYLDRAISSLPKIEEKKKNHITGDPVFDRLQKRKRDLFTNRKKLSNLFHDMIHVSDRKSNSAKINEVQVEIERVMLTIAHYEEHGSAPLSSDPYDLPKDPIMLRTKKSNAMSNRSRNRAKEIELQQDPEKNSQAIIKVQAKIFEYDQIIQHINEAIAAGL